MPNIYFYWLGTPIIERDQAVVHMETRKTIALLAYVSLSRSSLSRERLAAIFWPEFDQVHALGNLRRTLFSINKCLGQGIFISSRDAIRINRDFIGFQDIDDFQGLITHVKGHDHLDIDGCAECISELEKVTALYRGDFLQGFNLRDCPEFDDWQSMQRETCKTAFAYSLEKLSGVYAAQGKWDQAILNARKWLALDGLNENAQRMLIKTYALAGQRSSAVHQYEEYARMLQSELGQSPQAETLTLYQNIQSGVIENRVSVSESSQPRLQVGSVRQPLIKTKLYIPRLRTDLVSRQHLFTKMGQGAQGVLTLISAPAGYGKTTLLSEWIETQQKSGSAPPRMVCWLSLDPGDNDPVRFINYLAAALESVHPGVGLETRSLIQSDQPVHPTAPLSQLINEMEVLPQSVLLVLDDYQFITNGAIHDGMSFLLDHLPFNVHVVIATRSDPPFPLARLRGRNQLTEIRANDLRFTSQEIAEFLKNVYDLSLTPEQITLLENRTEGWIAGLQMAAISMRGRLDIAKFIEAFSGSHKFIMDYLAEEALNQQSLETQEFLLQTSILERLSEPLCDFVLNRKLAWKNKTAVQTPNPAIPGHENPGMLMNMELSNLFIIPLDDERIWYRYHHLFADLLRTRLQQYFPELITTLHTRASAWFEEHGWIEESIDHSFAAKDWDNSIRLVEHHTPTYLDNGQMATVIKWFEMIPQTEIFKNPKLCVQVAEVFAQAGMIEKIDPFLNQAEEIVTSTGEKTENFSINSTGRAAIQSMVGILRGLKSVCSGDPTGALFFTQKALADVPEMAVKERAVLFWVEGWAYRSLGNLSHALDIFKIATEFALEAGIPLRDTWTDLAFTYRLVGKLYKAIEIFTKSLQIAVDRGNQNQGNLSRDEAFLSLLYLEQNRLDLASSHASHAIANTHWWPSYNVIAIAYANLAQILLIQDDLDGSVNAIQIADRERKNRMMTPFVHSLVEVTWARIWVKQKNWDLLDQWSTDQMNLLKTSSNGNQLINEYLEMRLIMVVRIWLEKTKNDKKADRYEDCIQVITRMEESSQTAGRINSLVEILLLKAIVRFNQGKSSDALSTFDKCLSMAEVGGYVRIFLNSSESARALLAAYLEKTNPKYKPYALTILKAFGPSPHVDNLPEPITTREMEVLHLITEGYSNRQIAEELILTEGTVKFHVHNLLAKLQVDSRTQAIARAKELELI